jgi:hypothetical protein
VGSANILGCSKSTVSAILRDDGTLRVFKAWAWLAAEGRGLELVAVNPGLVLGPAPC